MTVKIAARPIEIRIRGIEEAIRLARGILVIETIVAIVGSRETLAMEVPSNVVTKVPQKYPACRRHFQSLSVAVQKPARSTRIPQRQPRSRLGKPRGKNMDCRWARARRPQQPPPRRARNRWGRLMRCARNAVRTLNLRKPSLNPAPSCLLRTTTDKAMQEGQSNCPKRNSTRNGAKCRCLDSKTNANVRNFRRKTVYSAAKKTLARASMTENCRSFFAHKTSAKVAPWSSDCVANSTLGKGLTPIEALFSN
mmetsp:Transcript_13183/g.24444  ORF Transcript_13183/g.24444 Transcript_13183/m.24444 type:complete len:252 (+) Transcript_13183:1177-1932(+)